MSVRGMSPYRSNLYCNHEIKSVKNWIDYLDTYCNEYCDTVMKLPIVVLFPQMLLYLLVSVLFQTKRQQLN